MTSHDSALSTPSRGRARGFTGRSAWWPVVPALLVGAVIPVIVAAASGNLAIPHNDSWAYSRIAETFGRTGRISLVGWNRSALVGQIVVLGPLARSIVVQQLFVAAMAVVLLGSVYLLLRDRIGSVRAGFAALLMACWPGFALLSTSFMADVPAFAALFLCLLLADRALSSDSRLLFALAMVAGLWSCTIRLQGIAAPAAAAIVFLLAHRRLRRVRPWFVVVVAGAALVLFLVFSLWRHSLPDGDHAAFTPSLHNLQQVVHDIPSGFFEIGLVCGPFALMSTRPARWRLRGWISAAAVLVVGAITYAKYGASGFFLPNYLAPQGAYAPAMQPMRATFHPLPWDVVLIVAVVLSAVLAGAIAEAEWSAPPLIVWFSAITLVGTVLTAVAGQSVFGRYLIALAPIAMLLAATPRRRRRRASAAEPAARGMVAPATLGIAALASTVVLLCISAGLAANAFSFDIARWRTAEAAAATGVPGSRIDAGLEWLGWHSASGVIDRNHPGPWGFERMFSTEPSCVVESSLPPEQLAAYLETRGWQLERVATYRTFLVAGHSAIWVYRTGAPGC